MRHTLCKLLVACALLGMACDDSPSRTSEPAPQPDAHAAAAQPAPTTPGTWSAGEIALFQSLSIDALPPVPPSPSNRVADDPVAARLGHRLFFDAGLSRDGSVSCASCHVTGLLFTDGLPLSRGVGNTNRNAPTIVGAAHSPWQFWDGRRDSLWAQALAPMEAGVEMGTTRVAAVRHVASDPQLAALYARVFGALPDLDAPGRFPKSAGPFGERDEQDAWYRMAAVDQRAIDAAFANIGKALAAYERLLVPGASRFDRWVAAVGEGRPPGPDARMTSEETAGLRLFIDSGRTLCLRCHNGPLLTNQAFHDIGTAVGEGRLPDFGRFLGLQSVLIDPFNCLGAYSDAPPDACKELRFIEKRHADEEMGKFKTPTLRGLARTGPYMHDGRFATLEAVVEHYRSPPAARDGLEITRLEIDDDEATALAAFLMTLDGGVDLGDAWLRAPAPAAN